MKPITFTLLAALALSGCATTYTYDGQKYDDKEKFHQAVDNSVNRVLAEIAPLPTPISKKMIIMAIPSEAVYIKVSIDNFITANGKEPTAAQREIIENLSKSNYKNTKIFADAVQRKNIYSGFQFIEMQEAVGTIAPSASTDTLYLVIPGPNSAQWFYSTAKGGKQIFSADRSSITASGKVAAFIDAVMAQAVRD